MQPLRTIILAAGRGTRVKSSVPKVLHPVCGKSIISYVLDLIKEIGSLKTYIVLGFMNEIIRPHLPKNIQVVIQKNLLGTADAIKSAEAAYKNFKGNILVLSGDTPLLTAQTIQSVINKQNSTGAAVTFLTVKVPDPQNYGRIIRDHLGRVTAIREEKDASSSEKEIQEINVGVYCFKSQLLAKYIRLIKVNAKKKEFYLTDIINLFSDEGLVIETVSTKNHEEGWGVNTREDLAFCESVMRKRILSQFMLDGVTIVDPQTTYINADVKIGQDTVIRPLTVIENDVEIGKNCLIGPFCRIRSGTKISDHVEIGNFTEISRSIIEENTFMKHFGFIGDAVLGKRVNIGAGTVTANFNGKEKNQTFIADDAFIGSDSILIAPVKIGKKAATGAGAVVTPGKSVPDGKVAVGMPAKVIARRKF